MNGRSRHLRLIAAALPMAAVLTGCVGERIGGPLIMEVDARNGSALLAAVNEKAQTCWIRSGDRAFRDLAVVPELDTRTGNPRLLIVERGKSTGLPKLVIEAQGAPVKITTYGPLAGASISARINDDVIAWAGGRNAC